MKVKFIRANSDRLLNIVSSPEYQGHKEIGGDLVAVHLRLKRVCLNKPVYVGVAILDISKCLMYDFYYNYYKARYGDKVHLIYTDTDSLVLEIETENIYKDMWEDKDKFDFSKYPKDGIYYDASNQKKIGKFKDETEGVDITEFAVLRSKMYSYRKRDDTSGHRAKGISRSVAIPFEDYKACLDHARDGEKITQYSLRSKQHVIGLYELNKAGLSHYDDKRYICEGGIKTYAYGHHRIVTNYSSR